MVYPMPVWYDFQARLSKVPSTSVAKQKMLERVNYFGQATTIDGQGRVLVPSVLREVAGSAATWSFSATPITSSSGTKSGFRSGLERIR